MAEWRGIQCAAKKLVITVEESRQVEIQKEISILQQLRHRNVIKFHATHAQNEDIYLIMDLAEKGDLAGAIKRKTLDWNTKPRIAHEIARGLEYIHDQGIVHSDLKSGNVLLTKYMEVKLCDFGVAQIRSVSLSKSGGRVGGTIRWMAPELFTVRPKYSAKSDIYALGMVMWEMAADCTPPFKSLANNTTVAAVVVRGEREIVPEETPDKYRQLLVQCWDQNPVKRPTAREVILHDPETDDSAAAESQESTDRSTVLHDAGGSEISLMSVTTTTASMSLSPRSSRTSVQRPGGSEEHGPPDVHALLARASDGNAEAQVALAVMFEDGIGVDKNDNASFRWYRLAAEQGSVEAQFKTGFYFLDGRGTKKNEQMAVYWFLKAARGEHSVAQAYLGRMLQDGRSVERDYHQEVEQFCKSGDQWYTGAENNLGWMCQHGIGVEQDDSRAVAWYRMSADQGNANAQNNLGWMYLHGMGVEQDDSQAAAWYRMSADQGNANAQNNLGCMYQHGFGVEQDYSQAVAWYRMSADQGNAVAQNSLGWMYQNGFGVKKDYRQAVIWYRKSADQGDAIAQRNLGWMYQHGFGVKANYKQAVIWYRKSGN